MKLFHASYPPHLHFPDPLREREALALLPYAEAFFEGDILGQEVTGWENVFQHCLTVAMAATALANAVPALLASQEPMRIAAFLHDAYKRLEIERIEREPQNPEVWYVTDGESAAWLRGLGYPEEVLVLQDAFGNNAAQRIFRGAIQDLPRRALHYIDDITQGNVITSLDERLCALENNPRYKEQNEWSRQLFDGLTLYEAKRRINGATEIQLADALGLERPHELPQWIRSKLDVIR